MFKCFNIFVIIQVLFLFCVVSIISYNGDDINSIRARYLTNDHIKKNHQFGFVDNKKRDIVNARGNEEYDLKGKKKKRGVANMSFSTNKKINTIQKQEIKNNNNEYFSKNYLNEEMSEEEYDEFIEELFKDFEV
jgi:hypothetical protein